MNLDHARHKLSAQHQECNLLELWTVSCRARTGMYVKALRLPHRLGKLTSQFPVARSRNVSLFWPAPGRPLTMYFASSIVSLQLSCLSLPNSSPLHRNFS